MGNKSMRETRKMMRPVEDERYKENDERPMEDKSIRETRKIMREEWRTNRSERQGKMMRDQWRINRSEGQGKL